MRSQWGRYNLPRYFLQTLGTPKFHWLKPHVPHSNASARALQSVRDFDCVPGALKINICFGGLFWRNFKGLKSWYVFMFFYSRVFSGGFWRDKVFDWLTIPTRKQYNGMLRVFLGVATRYFFSSTVFDMGITFWFVSPPSTQNLQGLYHSSAIQCQDVPNLHVSCWFLQVNDKIYKSCLALIGALRPM